MISMTITGAREIEAKLRALPIKVAKKTVRQAVRAGANVILPKVKDNARTLVGGSMGSVMVKNLLVRAFKKQRRGSYGLSVRYKSGIEELIHITADGVRYYVPAALEFGHARPGAGGSRVKDVPARPVIRNAFETTKEKAVKVVETGLARGVERAVIEG